MRAVVVVLVTLVLLAGCSSAAEQDTPRASARVASCGGRRVAPRVVGGVPDDDCDATPAVLYVHALGACSGVLVSPRVVLTARHCVAEAERSSTGGVNCGARISEHAKVKPAVDPALVTIAVDASPNARRVAVEEVITPSDDVLCDADLAIAVLAEPVTELDPLTIRLHSRAEGGEALRTIGFGKREDGTSGERFRDDGVRVRRVGPDAETPRLGAHEFETQRGFCQGDSGGPALSRETGAVVGIISRNQSCDADRGYVFTELAGFRTDIERAFASAGEHPRLEVSRSSVVQKITYALGNECVSGGDCDTSYCVAPVAASDQEERRFCSRSCAARADCPDGWSCSYQTGGAAMCVPAGTTRVRMIPALRPESHALDGAAGSGASCALAAGGAPSTFSAAPLVLAALFFAVRRRSRQEA